MMSEVLVDPSLSASFKSISKLGVWMCSECQSEATIKCCSFLVAFILSGMINFSSYPDLKNRRWVMKIGQVIFRKKWTMDFFIDKNLKSKIQDVYFFDIRSNFEIKEFQTCKQPCLLVGKIPGYLGNIGPCWAYSIADKRNI